MDKARVRTASNLSPAFLFDTIVDIRVLYLNGTFSKTSNRCVNKSIGTLGKYIPTKKSTL